MADSLQQDFGVLRLAWKQSCTTWENAELSPDPASGRHSAWCWSLTLGTCRASRWSFEQFGFEVISAPVGFKRRQRPPIKRLVT